MTTKVDDRKRIVISQARPGQVYAVHDNLDGSFTLRAIEPERTAIPTCRLAAQDGFPVAEPDQPIDEQAIEDLLAEFP